MEKFKGTKGQWNTYNWKGKGPVISIVCGEPVEMAPEIAQVYSQEEISHNELQGEEMKANAKLIAASPELLDALITLVELFDYKNQSMYLFAAKEIDAAKTVIKKIID